MEQNLSLRGLKMTEERKCYKCGKKATLICEEYRKGYADCEYALCERCWDTLEDKDDFISREYFRRPLR